MVAVTGASGFVGGAIIREILAAGQPVVALARTHSRISVNPMVRYRTFDLTMAIDDGLLEGVDGVIHCALVRNRSGQRASFEANVRGTLALFERAKSLGVPFLFFVFYVGRTERP